MAVCFTYKLWGTAGYPGLEHTRVKVNQAGQKINQKAYFYFEEKSNVKDGEIDGVWTKALPHVSILDNPE